MTVIIDIGHGMGNKRRGQFDPGAVSNGIREADIALAWGNKLRDILMEQGHKVIRTRRDNIDRAPIGTRAGIAKRFGGDIMLSIHCNAATGTASGTETFYRGEANKMTAQRINTAVVEALGTKDRGVKLESASQHARLAVMAFQPCFLVELGFIDHAGDRAAMLHTFKRKLACQWLAGSLTA